MGFLALTPFPLLVELEAPAVAGAVLARAAVICFLVTLLLRWLARLARPTPLLLASIDEDD